MPTTTLNTPHVPAMAQPLVASFDFMLLRDQMISTNDRDKHWGKRQSSAKQIRGDGMQLGRAHVNANRGYTPPERVDMVTVFTPPSRFRYDPPNYEPSVKPFIDGLVDAKVLPDDNATIVRLTAFMDSGEKTGKAGLWRVQIHLFAVPNDLPNGSVAWTL